MRTIKPAHKINDSWAGVVSEHPYKRRFIFLTLLRKRCPFIRIAQNKRHLQDGIAYGDRVNNYFMDPLV